MLDLSEVTWNDVEVPRTEEREALSHSNAQLFKKIERFDSYDEAEAAAKRYLE